MPVAVRNGWNIYFHDLFRERFDSFRARARALEARAAAGEITAEELLQHPDVKTFAALNELVNTRVPLNPGDPAFEQGKTLGKIGKGWRRVKGNGLPDRHRLYFRYDSASMAIVFAWLNDERTLRKAGASTDCYEVFQKMLGRGRPPAAFGDLLAEVQAQEQAREQQQRGAGGP